MKRSVPNVPGEFCSISVVESTRAGIEHWRFVCRSNAMHLDERNVRYTEEERRDLKSKTIWDIEQVEPPPEKHGNWEHVWRFRLAMAEGFTDVAPMLIRFVKERFPKRRKLMISVD
jgi:hypothetical protein